MPIDQFIWFDLRHIIYTDTFMVICPSYNMLPDGTMSQPEPKLTIVSWHPMQPVSVRSHKTIDKSRAYFQELDLSVLS